MHQHAALASQSTKSQDNTNMSRTRTHAKNKRSECDRGLYRILGPKGPNMRWKKVFQNSTQHSSNCPTGTGFLMRKTLTNQSVSYCVWFDSLCSMNNWLLQFLSNKHLGNSKSSFIWNIILQDYYIAILLCWDGSAIIAFIWYLVTHLTS